MIDKETIQKLYIRICKDSGYNIDPVDAAILTSRILKISGLHVWLSLDMDKMARIADGTHPCVNNPRYV